jgi:hypothetical protein
MLDHPEGLLAGSLMLDSNIAGSGGSLDWNVRTLNKNFLVFVGLNVSDRHNMIKLVKIDDNYQGDLQLDSSTWKLLRSIQVELVARLSQQQFIKSNLQLIPLLGNVQAHIDGKLHVVSPSKWSVYISLSFAFNHIISL